VKKLSSDRKKLRANKPVLDFEQAADLFRRKAKMLDEIAQLEAVKIKLSTININEQTQPDALESYYYSLGLNYGSRDNLMFKISNLTVIYEFIDFVFTKVSNKIDALKEQVQQM